MIHSHFSTTQDSQQLQPVREAAPLVLLCSSFAAAAYLAQQITARSLAADVAATASWLSQLADNCSHSVSLAATTAAAGCEKVSSAGGAIGDSSQCISQTGAGSSSSSSLNKGSGTGLVVMEVGAVRAAMLKMAGVTLG
jgi:hypothetical protein